MWIWANGNVSVYILRVCLLHKWFRCVYWKMVCTLYNVVHSMWWWISINVVACKKENDHWIQTNMTNLRACYWIMNWNFGHWMNTIEPKTKASAHKDKRTQKDEAASNSQKRAEKRAIRVPSKCKPSFQNSNVTLQCIFYS